MTINEASNKLFVLFSENESMNIDSFSDKESFFGDKKFSKVNVAALIGALEEFEKMDIIKKIVVENETIYILQKSFNSFEQTIKLSVNTCGNIAELINGFCEILKNETDKSDPKNITEKDIKNLATITANLLKLRTEKEEEQ